MRNQTRYSLEENKQKQGEWKIPGSSEGGSPILKGRWDEKGNIIKVY